MWEHEFICLASCSQIMPPTPMEKAELIRAGLGPRKLSLFEFGDTNQFHDELIGAFPKLLNGGGYELMRTRQENNRELYIIPPPSAGYTVEYIKNIVSQAKVYIRPIQKDLSLDPEVDETDDLMVGDPFFPLIISYHYLLKMQLAPSEMCMQCGNIVPMHQLRLHMENWYLILILTNWLTCMAIIMIFVVVVILILEETPKVINIQFGAGQAIIHLLL